MTNAKKNESFKIRRSESQIVNREHSEFHNCYTEKHVKQDIEFLNYIYDDKTGLTEKDVTPDFLNYLKSLGKEIYFFIQSMEQDVTPQSYIKRKYEFRMNTISDGNPHLFFLAWNGLIKNDSFKRLMRKTFTLSAFNDILCPQHIPHPRSTLTRYRTKLVLADDMAKCENGHRRTKGRTLDDGSGLIMQEDIIWLPNGKAIPLFPSAYVPLNQTQVVLVRHGKSIHESGGDNPEFVGSGYWDIWDKNRRISGSMGNHLKEAGIDTAKELGKDFKVIIDTLSENGTFLWSWSKENPILVYGSESENTEQTGRYFLSEASYNNISFNAVYGLNSQKYGALTHKFKNDVFKKCIEIYGKDWTGTDSEKKAKVKAMFKNRFYHFPEGETLLEADWRIGFSFVDLLHKNQGKRIVLADHSGAIRVFEAIIKTLDFADYCTRKEGHDSIVALCFQPGRNLRYDYLQHAKFPLRKREQKTAKTEQKEQTPKKNKK